MTTGQINAFFPSDFAIRGRQFIPMGQDPPGVRLETRWIEIPDARPLQSVSSSESGFFAGHGFVLLPHSTRVRDWTIDPESPFESEVARLYLPEIETVIRERLLPGRRVEIQQGPFLIRRGRDTETPFYAEGAHQDFGLTPDDYQRNVSAFANEEAARWWRLRFEQSDVAGFMVVDFWRTTNMAGPLRHMPLALCDPGSVDRADLVPTAMDWIAPDGKESHHLALRSNPSQRWYHYPAMTGDELLAFKLFEVWKDDRQPRFASCFHSAFRDPDTPVGAEQRQSCEHRVGVLVLQD
ncbi:MAG: symbB [Alphaproteobacteria bacterium]|nr:symbB [Alphaproteobacteria bacterium]